MLRQFKSVMAWIALAAGTFGGCSSCEEKNDEKLIIALIEQAAVHAENHKAGKIMKLATEDFVAQPGSRDKDETRSVLAYAFMRYGSFKIKFPKPAITIPPYAETARAKVPFIVIREGTLIPDLDDLYNDPEQWISRVGKTVDPYHLELWLVRTEDGWKVQKADIQGLRGLEGL